MSTVVAIDRGARRAALNRHIWDRADRHADHDGREVLVALVGSAINAVTTGTGGNVNALTDHLLDVAGASAAILERLAREHAR